MVLRQVRSLSQFGDTMRILPFLLLVGSVLLVGCDKLQAVEHSPDVDDAAAAIEKQKQDAAVAAIRKLGGTVTFDEKNPAKPLVAVDLSLLPGIDAGLAHLKGLTSLQDLYLPPNMTDAGLEHLKGLTSLETLGLGRPNVTDAGLEHLKGLTSLRTLYLDAAKVTDGGMKGLQSALPKCRIRTEWGWPVEFFEFLPQLTRPQRE